MKTFILVLGLWTTAEGLVSLLFPGAAKRFARKLFGTTGESIAQQSDATLRKLAALELGFGIWMLALWKFT